MNNNVAAFFVDNALIPLIKMEMYIKRTTNKLKMNPTGYQPLKNIKINMNLFSASLKALTCLANEH